MRGRGACAFGTFGAVISFKDGCSATVKFV